MDYSSILELSQSEFLSHLENERDVKFKITKTELLTNISNLFKKIVETSESAQDTYGWPSLNMNIQGEQYIIYGVKLWKQGALEPTYPCRITCMNYNTKENTDVYELGELKNWITTNIKDEKKLDVLMFINYEKPELFWREFIRLLGTHDTPKNLNKYESEVNVQDLRNSTFIEKLEGKLNEYTFKLYVKAPNMKHVVFESISGWQEKFNKWLSQQTGKINFRVKFEEKKIGAGKALKPTKPRKNSLESLTVKELKERAKLRKLKGYSTLKKADLIALLRRK